MGNKVNPIGMRLQVNRTWDSRWYADTKDYGDLLLEDLKIKAFIREECKQSGVSRVIIERPHKKCRVTIHAARPGVIIGKKGADIETLRKKLANFTDSELRRKGRMTEHQKHRPCPLERHLGRPAPPPAPLPKPPIGSSPTGITTVQTHP